MADLNSSLHNQEFGSTLGTTPPLEKLIRDFACSARQAANDLANATSEQKNNAITGAAKAIRSNMKNILEANACDLKNAEQNKLRVSLIDRLKLDIGRLESIAVGLESIANLPDPIGTVMNTWTQSNGLQISRVRVPLGVIAIIYESRPNVTADAAAICLKAGNPVILRGGSESLHSSHAIWDCIAEGLKISGLNLAAVQIVPTTDRDAVGFLLNLPDLIDVIVPRGGKSLIERVQNESKIPVMAHLEGLCHVFLDSSADAGMAHDIVLNSKMRRTSVCGAMETLLIDRSAANNLLPLIAESLVKSGCALRGDSASKNLVTKMEMATENDWTTEYLDAILSIKLVDGVGEAIHHINTYGSNHTDTIVTNNVNNAERFLKEVDSAIVLHNASTQYADGGEFGMGAEIGISTGRLHARGPIGVEQLTSFKYIVRGNGQVRP